MMANALVLRGVPLLCGDKRRAGLVPPLFLPSNLERRMPSFPGRDAVEVSAEYHT